MAVLAAVPAVASAGLILNSATLATTSGPSGARLMLGTNSNAITNSMVSVQRTNASGVNCNTTGSGCGPLRRH
jgi:hypothetical protein